MSARCHIHQLALIVSHAISVPPKRICEQNEKPTYFVPPRRNMCASVCRVSNKGRREILVIGPFVGCQNPAQHCRLPVRQGSGHDRENGAPKSLARASLGVERTSARSLGDLIVIDRPEPAWPGFVQQIHAILGEAAPPPQLSRDGLAGNGVGATKNDPAPLGHGSCHTLPTHLSFQILALPAPERPSVGLSRSPSLHSSSFWMLAVLAFLSPLAQQERSLATLLPLTVVAQLLTASVINDSILNPVDQVKDLRAYTAVMPMPGGGKLVLWNLSTTIWPRPEPRLVRPALKLVPRWSISLGARGACCMCSRRER